MVEIILITATTIFAIGTLALIISTLFKRKVT